MLNGEENIESLSTYLLNKKNAEISMQERVDCYFHIMRCLSTTKPGITTTEDRLLRKQLQPIIAFLDLGNSIEGDLRQSFLNEYMNKFLDIISEKDPEPSPVMMVMLKFFNENYNNNNDIIVSWVRQKDLNDPMQKEKLQTSLNYLYGWMTEWQCTDAMATWILRYINILEEDRYIDVLIDTTLGNMEQLFETIVNPKPSVRFASRVVLYVFSCLREEPEVENKIIGRVVQIMKWLRADTRFWARNILQDFVDVLAAILNAREEDYRAEALEAYRKKNEHVYDQLKLFEVSTNSQILRHQVWDRYEPKVMPMELEPTGKRVGLVNLGNTCFLNSVMQALLLTNEFRNHAIMHMANVPYWSSIAQLFTRMEYTRRKSVNPIYFYETVRPRSFLLNQPQDSSEFLVHLLTLLHENEACTASPDTHEIPRAQVIDIPKPEKPKPEELILMPTDEIDGPLINILDGIRMPRPESPNSFIQHLFRGRFVTAYTCKMCSEYIDNDDYFREIQLAFPEKPANGERYMLQELMDYYYANEILKNNVKFLCRNCKNFQVPNREGVIVICPRYLIFVIKTFRYDMKLRRQSKLMHRLYCNDTVDLKSLATPLTPSAYTLYGAVIHSGTSIDSGHYYSVAKDNGQWYDFDDEVVTRCDDDILKNLGSPNTPYMLFYRREDVVDIELPVSSMLPSRLLDAIY